MPTLLRIDHIHVFVSDRVQAEAWYSAVLGLRRDTTLEFWAADGGPLTLADDSGAIHIALFERPKRDCRSTIAFAVSGTEFAAWKVHLTRALGTPPRIEDHEVSWSLYFADPDGNPFEITTYDYAAVAS